MAIHAQPFEHTRDFFKFLQALGFLGVGRHDPLELAAAFVVSPTSRTTFGSWWVTKVSTRACSAMAKVSRIFSSVKIFLGPIRQVEQVRLCMWPVMNIGADHQAAEFQIADLALDIGSDRRGQGRGGRGRRAAARGQRWVATAAAKVPCSELETNFLRLNRSCIINVLLRYRRNRVRCNSKVRSKSPLSLNTLL